MPSPRCTSTNPRHELLKLSTEGNQAHQWNKKYLKLQIEVRIVSLYESAGHGLDCGNMYSGVFSFFRFFKNNFVKIELYLSSNISLKRAQKLYQIQH